MLTLIMILDRHHCKSDKVLSKLLRRRIEATSLVETSIEVSLMSKVYRPLSIQRYRQTLLQVPRMTAIYVFLMTAENILVCISICSRLVLSHANRGEV